jgi:hypothetical protein
MFNSLSGSGTLRCRPATNRAEVVLEPVRGTPGSTSSTFRPRVSCMATPGDEEPHPATRNAYSGTDEDVVPLRILAFRLHCTEVTNIAPCFASPPASRLSRTNAAATTPRLRFRVPPSRDKRDPCLPRRCDILHAETTSPHQHRHTSTTPPGPVGHVRSVTELGLLDPRPPPPPRIHKCCSDTGTTCCEDQRKPSDCAGSVNRSIFGCR